MNVADQVDYVEAVLNNPQIKMVRITDAPCDVDFEQTMTQIVAAYEKKLPNKSSFEK